MIFILELVNYHKLLARFSLNWSWYEVNRLVPGRNTSVIELVVFQKGLAIQNPTRSHKRFLHCGPIDSCSHTRVRMVMGSPIPVHL